MLTPYALIGVVLSLAAPLIAALGILSHCRMSTISDHALSSLQYETLTRHARHIATAGAGIGCFGALWIALVSASTPPWLAWIPLFVSLIGLVAVSLSPLSQTTSATFARILCIHAASVGMVLVHDALASGTLWALAIIPMWRELQSRPLSKSASRTFALYMLPSVVLVALGTFLLSQGHVAAAIFPLAAGISIREAVVPMHRWFVKMVEHAPLGMVVVFSMPQLGMMMHLRFLSHQLPPQLVHVAATLGVITAIFAAMMGMVQSQARKAIAYLIISQSGLVAFGLEPSSEIAHTGALLIWIVVGIATAGFAMTIAALEARRGTLLLDHPTGNFERIPRLAAAFLILGLASVGLPGTLGFIAEDLLVQGSVDDFPVLALALTIATAMNGITVVRSFFALFTGTSKHIGEHDLTLRETAVLTLVFVLLGLGGIWPAGALAIMSH